MEILACSIALIIGVSVGIFIGIFIGVNRMKKAVEERSVGHLRIDRSEPDCPPKAFWEIVGTSIEQVSKKDFVVLKVVNEDYVSRD